MSQISFGQEDMFLGLLDEDVSKKKEEVKFSYLEFSSYDRCPHSYFLLKNNPKERVVTSSMVDGLLFHKIAEDWVSSGTFHKNDLFILLETHINKPKTINYYEWTSDIEFMMVHYKLKKLLDNFYNFFMEHKWNEYKILPETYVEVKYEPEALKLTGRVDQKILGPDWVLNVDLKAGDPNNSYHNKSDQLVYYSLIDYLKGYNKVGAGFLFVQGEKASFNPVKIDDKSLKNLLQRIIRHANGVRAKDFKPKLGSSCSQCLYRFVCEPYKELVPELSSEPKSIQKISFNKIR